ncbi:DUF1376 domain-containing protein [Stenotrophomonas sp. PS02298]|uniref:DUF1376 domain-containing protein n=1 Tax=Stenotrophomonas sp. PS02298 TaxID=2991424 RepID=UPI00249B54F1|nr:DUF1376 domain-containing protein [Stenotrophomonas sp. PS02298]
MNYYPRYPAHYQTKTLHLTMEQDGAYTRLLDWYYANERPIPHAQRHAIARAMTPSERRATDLVLGEFFEQQEGLWTQYRCESEIEKARPKIDAAKANGKKGGRPRKQAEPGAGERAGVGTGEEEGTRKKPNGFSLGSENGTHDEPGAKAPQSPIPINPPDTPLQAPEIAEGATDAGRACLLIRQVGCVHTNPSHPDLLAALAEGVTPETLALTVAEAMEKTPPVTKPFNWAIATARSRHAAGAKPVAPGVTHEGHRESTADRTRRLAEEGEQRERDSEGRVFHVAQDAVGAHG